MSKSALITQFIKSALVVLAVVLPTVPIFAQAVAPEREQLLNGLNVLIWNRPGDPEVVLKLRIHSGAAFDLAGKAGEMALLGDLLFPDVATREYFVEEMQGRLNVATNYDSIDITMQGRANEFERIVEILRNALVNTQLTPEVITRVREGRIKVAKETTISPSIVADRAVAIRLFGDYPYGQPYAGTAESLARIDRADLMLARERFLNPNNATLAISGGVPKSRLMRALRQLLGGWRKSEQVPPATFKQPDPPDSRILIVNVPSEDSAEIRLAVRGLARSDGDHWAATLLASIARKRWESLIPELTRKPAFVRHEPNLLPGSFVFGAAVDRPMTAKSLDAARNVMKSLAINPVSSEELEQALNEVLRSLDQERAQKDGLADAWLDLETYKLPSLENQLATLRNVSVSDLQKTATRLFSSAPLAQVVVGDSNLLKVELAKSEFQILGDASPAQSKTGEPAKTSPAAPAPKP